MKKFIFFAGLVRGLGPENFSPKVCFLMRQTCLCQLKMELSGDENEHNFKGEKIHFLG